ncbi:MAG: hypothetical protein WCO05_04340 [Candidatus Moraniibacteriota bacterium]
MTETLTGELWYWQDVKRDLESQGGINGVLIDERSASRYFFAGKTKNKTWFHVLWEKDSSVVLSVSQEESALIIAFGKVLGYLPFCRYVSDNGLLTFEWDKNNVERRFVELQEGGVADLQSI